MFILFDNCFFPVVFPYVSNLFAPGLDRSCGWHEACWELRDAQTARLDETLWNTTFTIMKTWISLASGCFWGLQNALGRFRSFNCSFMSPFVAEIVLVTVGTGVGGAIMCRAENFLYARTCSMFWYDLRQKYRIEQEILESGNIVAQKCMTKASTKNQVHW